MDKMEITERVKRYLAAGVNPPTIWEDDEPSIFLALDLAVNALTSEIVRDPARAYLLRKSFGVNSAANQIDLAAVNTGYELMADSLTSLYDAASGVQYHKVGSLFDLRGWLQPGFAHYTLADNKIYLRPAGMDWAQAGQMPATALELSVVAKPKSLANLPDALVEDLVLKTAELLLNKPISNTPNE